LSIITKAQTTPEKSRQKRLTSKYASYGILEPPKIGVVMVIEVQKDNYIALDEVDDHPIANVGAHHASQVMTKSLTDKWVVADLGELFINAIPQNVIFLGKTLKILLKSRCKA
jgi:hypothetical protein